MNSSARTNSLTVRSSYPITNPLCSARAVPGFGCDELQRTQHLTLYRTWTITPR